MQQHKHKSIKYFPIYIHRNDRNKFGINPINPFNCAGLQDSLLNFLKNRSEEMIFNNFFETEF